MPSGTMSTITMAPPGVFATSMPPELSHSASPVPSSEDRESVSSTESRRRRVGGLTNGTSSATGSISQNLSSFHRNPSPTFVIESPKPDHSNEPFSKVRKKSRYHRSRGNGAHNGNSPYGVNHPLRVTIRRTNAHSHTLDSALPDGTSANRLSPSSVYSSVPGDDESSPIRLQSPQHHQHNIPNSSSKAVDYSSRGESSRRDVAVSTSDQGTSTDADLIGPCEPGSKVNLIGSVWMETPGMLCVSVNWRGRSYVGTLTDASKCGLNLACPSKMITSLAALKNKITWNPTAPAGSNLTPGPPNNVGTVKTRSGNLGIAENRGRPIISTRGRRKRRGFGQLTTSASSCTLVSDGMDSNQEDEAPNSVAQSEVDYPIECPFVDCGRRFADIRCAQCHVQQAHGPVNKKSKVEFKPEDLDVPRSSSPSAPQLAKAVSSECTIAEGVANDEDIPPPTLDRGPSVSEEQIPPSGDHPPTASPAYSDISDDAPINPKITVPKTAVESNPSAPSPWQTPPVPSQKPSIPPQPQNQTQSQPLDWSRGPRMTPGPTISTSTSSAAHSRPPSIPPSRSSYDFDPAIGSQHPYPYLNFRPPYQNPSSNAHSTAISHSQFNVPRHGIPDVNQNPIAAYVAYQEYCLRQGELHQNRSPQSSQQSSQQHGHSASNLSQFRPPQ